MPTGRCHCGAIVYAFDGEALRSSICNCRDCQRCAGAASVAWIAVPREAFRVEQGAPVVYRSSPDTERWFCGTCGAGLFYINEVALPGLVDIQTATLDDLEAFPPQAQVQCAEAPVWAATLHELPRFDRFPSAG